jgi:hypothetical protein
MPLKRQNWRMQSADFAGLHFAVRERGMIAIVAITNKASSYESSNANER